MESRFLCKIMYLIMTLYNAIDHSTNLRIGMIFYEKSLSTHSGVKRKRKWEWPMGEEWLLSVLSNSHGPTLRLYWKDYKTTSMAPRSPAKALHQTCIIITYRCSATIPYQSDGPVSTWFDQGEPIPLMSRNSDRDCMSICPWHFHKAWTPESWYKNAWAKGRQQLQQE